MGFASTTLTLSESLTLTNTAQNTAISDPVASAVGIALSSVLKWKAPCQAIDQLALNLFNKIKQRQLDIATLGSNVGLSSQCYSDSTSVLTSLYGNLVSGVGVTYGQTLGIVGVGTTTNVAYGVIKYDTLESLRYPNLETLNTSTDNPIENEGYVTITSSNVGIGKSTRYTASAGSSAATVFAYAASKTGVGNCASYTGIANSISSVKAQYDSESAGIATYITDVNLIKGYKHSAQLEYWALNKSINNMSIGVASNTSILNILDDPYYGGPY